MTSFELFERTESYCIIPSKIGTALGKYQTLQKHNTVYLSLNRFFHLKIAKVIPEFQNQTSKKIVLQYKEVLE